MSTIGNLLPIRRPVFWVVAVCLVLATLPLVWSFSSSGNTLSNDKVSLVVALPLRPPAAGDTIRTITSNSDVGADDVAGSPANPAFTTPSLDPLKPNEPDLQLVDASPLGPLPRIAEDGRRPMQVYARSFDQSDARPKIAIMVTGLGLQADSTNATFHLPGAVSLMFSPYGEELPSLFERARLAGHEVLLELPMEPGDYPTNDPGPHTLRASGTVDANVERLNWVLSRAQGYFAVGGQGGAFAESPEAAPIMKAIAERGVGFIEIDGSALSSFRSNAGLVHISTPNWIDETPTADAIDEKLGELEALARRDGIALGVAEPYPITLQRLVEWTATLEQRGIALVPASSLLLGVNGVLVEGDQASSVAQSEN
jgi:polysaccharide deacetylase 2 family uncharacterized protein YibQ